MNETPTDARNVSGRLQVPFRLVDRRVWVAGHRGMVGQALLRRLNREQCEILTVDRQSLDLRRQRETEEWMAANRPEVVFLAAATVGGIHANDTRPAEFLYDNLLIEAHLGTDQSEYRNILRGYEYIFR